MKVLIVEADRATARSMELLWGGGGNSAYTTDEADEAVELAKIYTYDLITVDDVDDLTALKLVGNMRRSGVKTPILAVGRFETGARCDLLAAGADGVLTKPVERDELLAMGKAIVRRSQGRAGNTVNIGPAVVDLDVKSVTVGENNIHLTGKEFSMLELLIARRELLVSKEAFLNYLYGGMDEPEMKIIDVFICKLRNKLRVPLGGEYIDTIWGRGYTLRNHPIAVTEKTKSPYLMKRGRYLGSQRGQVLAVLARIGEGGLTSVGVNNRMTAAGRTNLESTRSAIGLAVRDGYADSRGPHGQRIYSLTPAGMDWLKSAGYEPEAETEAEAA